MVLHGLADILKVLLYRLADIDAPEGGAQAARQLHGVVPGAVGGTEAGHGDGDNIAGGTAEQFHRHGGDQNGQGGVQPAGESHHGSFGPGVLQPLLETQGGDLDDLLAALGPLAAVLRDEGRGGDMTGQGRGARLQGEIPGGGLPARGGERVHPPPLIGQRVHIQLGDGEAGGKAPLGQQPPVLRNQVVAGEYHVSGGLPLPRVGVHIAAAEPGGLSGGQFPAVSGLAHRLIAGGEIQNQRGSLRRQAQGGRLGGPEILADLHADGESRHLRAAEHQTGGEVHRRLSREGDGAARPPQVLPGGKPAGLVELTVVGDMGLGHQAEELPPADYRGAVVELVPVPHGQAQSRHHVQVLGGLQYGGEGLLGAPEQGVLQKQIAAGVPGEAELGQGQHPHSLCRRLPHQVEAGLGVVPAVRHFDSRRARRRLDKAVSHESRPPLRLGT